LEKQIAEQDSLFREAREEYKDRARAAYKGESLKGFLAGWFGAGEGDGGVVDPRVSAILLQNRQDLLEYQESGQDLRNTRRQISQKQDDYRVALERVMNLG
jgi:hypothetical protein